MVRALKALLTISLMLIFLSACGSGSNDPAFGENGSIPVEAVYIDPEVIMIGVGETKSLSAIFEPANATNQNVIWDSDDDAMVTVNDDGEIRGISEGLTTIFVISEDGAFTSSCTVRVIVPVEEFSIANCPDGYVVMDQGTAMTLNFTIEPELDATHVRLQGFSTNLDAVSLGTKTFTSYNILADDTRTGEAEIIVSTFPSMETTSCRVIVKEAADPDPDPANVATQFFTTLLPNPTPPAIPELPYIGDKLQFERGSLDFNMIFIHAPQGGPTTVSDVFNPDLGGYVENPYYIGETEVTYKLWYTVRMWATTDRGDGKRADGEPLYTFYWRGMGGSDGIEAEPPTDENQNHPVTHISWRAAMVWTNALTEYYNAHKSPGEPSLSCVYYTDADYTTPIRLESYGEVSQTAGSQDNPFVRADATGFRLPTSREWELAARFRGGDTTNAISGDFGVMYTKGNSASDAVTFYNDVTPGSGTSTFAGQEANRAVAVYARFKYWTSNSIRFLYEPVTSTATVKTKRANTLGLYDMSGNVGEFCFDRYRETDGPSQIFRVLRGGAWGTKNQRDYLPYGDNEYLQIGLETRVDPRYVAPWGYNTGFRLAQSAVNQ